MDRAALLEENQRCLDELRADIERRQHLRDIGLVREWESEPPPQPLIITRLYEPQGHGAIIERAAAGDDDTGEGVDLDRALAIIVDEVGRAVGEHQRQASAEIRELRREVAELRAKVNSLRPEGEETALPERRK